VRSGPADWPGYGLAATVVVFCTASSWAMFPYFELSNIIMVYLLGVVGVSAWTGRGPSVLASVLSVLAFDFFFVPPYLSFTVLDSQYIVTFSVMLIVALVISGLTVRIRGQAASARERERRTATLYALSRELAGTRGMKELLDVAVRHLLEVFGGQIVILLPNTTGRLDVCAGSVAPVEMDPHDVAASQWAYEHRQMAGIGTDNLLSSHMLFVPLLASRGIVGVLGMRLDEAHALETPEQRHLLETFSNQIALAVERGLLAEEAHTAQISAQTEHLRNALLSSVSHDLRTPLASITGSASSLLESGDSLDARTRRELLQAIHEEADRLNRLVQNLLEMTRLESGAVTVRKEWHPIEELVGAALGRLGTRLGARPVLTRIPADLPLVPLDGVLIEQLLLNLIDNALKYTPEASPIEIAASVDDGGVAVEVADRGPGLAPEDQQRVFDKLYRGQAEAGRGSGLGLAICRGIVEAHGGRIWAENRSEGGVAFRFTLPVKEMPPSMLPADG
jgi:two-component system sensor histidine kinase KdpD